MKTIEYSLLEHDQKVTVNAIMAVEDQLREFLLWYWRNVSNPGFLLDDEEKVNHQINLTVRRYRTRILRHEEE